MSLRGISGRSIALLENLMTINRGSISIRQVENKKNSFLRMARDDSFRNLIGSIESRCDSFIICI